jgi:nuclease S1
MTNRIRLTARGVAALGVIVSLCSVPTAVYAWGDEGHEVIGHIATHYLTKAVKAKVNAILATDTTKLTPSNSIDVEATWADKFRDSDRNTTKVHFNETENWHFVDLEISGPDLKSACFGEPPLNGALASNGPAKDCIVDKINEFTTELKDPATLDQERLFALQFLLHFVGDIHQPLHASDEHDRGGNDKSVTAAGVEPTSGVLHGFWDTQFVKLQGTSETAVANELIKNISAADRKKWQSGTAADWAQESFDLAKSDAYGKLPAPDSNNHYTLPDSYVTNAKAVVAQQLSKAGVRLAFVLNAALK